MAWIAPSKNVSGPVNLTAGTQYSINATLKPSAPTGLTTLDSQAIEEGTSPKVDTSHGNYYWQIATDGTTVYAISPPTTGGVYVATIQSGALGGASGSLSKPGLGLGTVGEEIALAVGVIVVIVIIAVLVHFKR